MVKKGNKKPSKAKKAAKGSKKAAPYAALGVLGAAGAAAAYHYSNRNAPIKGQYDTPKGGYRYAHEDVLQPGSSSISYGGGNSRPPRFNMPYKHGNITG